MKMVEMAVLEVFVLGDRFLNGFPVKMANWVFDPRRRLNYMMLDNRLSFLIEIHWLETLAVQVRNVAIILDLSLGILFQVAPEILI